MLIYNFKGNDSQRIKFNRKLLNYNTQSHKGKYKKKTKGILQQYQKPTRSLIIFQKNNLKKIKKILTEFKIDYALYEIKQLKNPVIQRKKIAFINKL